MQLEGVIPEQTQGSIAVDLGHMPFDHDAGVDDQTCQRNPRRSPARAHRARSSASNAALSA